MSSSSAGKPAGKPKASAAASREQARLRREEQQKRDRRRRMSIVVGAPVLVVILIIVGFIVVKANQKPAAATTSPSVATSTSLDASLSASIGSISAATFDAVGKGTGVSAPTAVTGAALTADGKPRVLYIGAEYCPYCAAQRWAVAAALSRFGTFSGLGASSSSSIDVYPSTATLSFHGATYTSSLLSFTGVEETTNVLVDANNPNKGYTALDTATAADKALMSAYDTAGSIPFVDFGNRYVTIGASYLPTALQGLTQAQIVADLQKPDTDVAKGAIGAANAMTAALCRLTGNQPAAVCSSSAVTSQALPS